MPAVLDELSELVSGGDDIELAFQTGELVNALDAFLDTLSSEKRCIFVCRYWYSDSISDIAVRFGMKDGAVTMTLSRLRKKLHSYLDERGFEI